MMFFRSLSSLALVLLCTLSFTNAEETIRVLSPHNLSVEFPNGISETPALFGFPPYGGAISGVVVYATHGDRDGCAPLIRDSTWPPQGQVMIMLISRGNCTFVTKVRNAQNAGAQAVIVADNVEEGYIPFMADDGTGSSITIPSALIDKEDGDKLIEYILNNSTVWVTMTWSVANPDNHVEWDFWTSANDPASKDFKKNFRAVADALGNTASMTPHYFIYDGRVYGCRNAGEPCGLQCTNHGRYCAVDPEHDRTYGLDGEDVVKENLRQACLFTYLNSTGQPLKWWDYVVMFDNMCSGSESTWNDTCAYKCMTSLNINVAAVQSCVAQSGGTDGDVTNSVLEYEMNKLYDDDIYFLPTIVINSSPYRGSMNCPAPTSPATCGVFGAICGGFADDALPAACTSDSGCALGTKRDACGLCGGNGQVDACSLCLPVTSQLFNKTCAGCDGVPFSGARHDPCGICNGDGEYDVCGRCFSRRSPMYNKTCSGCDGVPLSGKMTDLCGVCGGTGSLDVCGQCFQASDSRRVTNSSLCPEKIVEDVPGKAGLSVPAISGIVVVSVFVVGSGVFFYMRRQQRKMREDIDSLLHQYLPLDKANNLSHPSRPQSQKVEQDRKNLLATDANNTPSDEL